MPAGGDNGRQYGWRTLSRRAKHFESQAEFANYTVARMLRRESLHPRIAEKAWMAFMRGDFDFAAFHSMKQVAVAVREVTKSSGSLLSTKLMQDAFAPRKSSLADKSADKGEQVGCLNLFLGAIAFYKNPHSHET